MSTAVVFEVITAMVGVGLTAAAFFAATRANRAQAKASGLAVDAAAYGRAREIYDAAMDTLKEEREAGRQEIRRLGEQITAMREAYEKVRESNDSLRLSNDSLRLEIHRLREEVTALRSR